MVIVLTLSSRYIGDLYHQESSTAFEVAKIDATRFGTVSMLAFATSATIINLTLPHFVTLGSTSTKVSSPRNSFTLPRAWLIAHLLAAMSFLLLGLTRSSSIATLLITVLGISWALTQWAPFALIGEELAKARQQSHHSKKSDIEKLQVASDDETQNQTGLILGLHNLAISAPQIVAAVGSSMLFWCLERFGIVGTDAIGWILMFGAIPACAAAWWAWAVEEDA